MIKFLIFITPSFMIIGNGINKIVWAKYAIKVSYHSKNKV
jgi:hypothetical protein